MLSFNNNNAYDHIGRERQVIELYKQGKSTRDIAKELRMSLRDISIILRKNQASHGIVIMDNGNNNNNKSPNQKSTQAYKLFSEGRKPVDVAILLNLSEKDTEDEAGKIETCEIELPHLGCSYIHNIRLLWHTIYQPMFN
jgi:IS30 family transposase